MSLFDWLSGGPKLARISIPVGHFNSDATEEFTEELGMFGSANPEAATELLAFIKDIQANPYEPNKVVNRCFFISKDNLLFKAKIKDIAILIWRIDCKNYYSNRGEDWTVRFLKLQQT